MKLRPNGEGSLLPDAEAVNLNCPGGVRGCALPGIYRDTAPDREPVILYTDGGSVRRVVDVDVDHGVMEDVRRLARQRHRSERQIIRQALRAATREVLRERGCE